MEKYFSEILGTPVITESSGAVMGRVLDILIHPENGQVVALSLFPGFRKIVVPMDIRGWYREIIIADGSCVLQPNDVLRVQNILEQGIFFLRNRAYTRSGKYLGKVVDFSINIETMSLMKIVVAKSIFGLVNIDQRIFSFQNIVEVTAKKIVVKDDAGAEKSVSVNLTTEGSI